jgi:putative CocE/NonD family hydrolase
MYRNVVVWTVIIYWTAVLSADANSESPVSPEAANVDLSWNVKIRMRDGTDLSATLYRPKAQTAPRPCIFIMTPYVGDSYHERGIYFAAHGYPFLTVDVRGRGDSNGQFRPFIQEANDGYDTVEWLAKQRYCNGEVAMWGGSYDGYVQWATAKALPPHLATIVPASACYPGIDVPMRNNVFNPSWLAFLIYTDGHALHAKASSDWSTYVEWYRSGRPLKALDAMVGDSFASKIYQEWLSHPSLDAYWDTYVLTPEQYRKLQIPILTITGAYDGDQLGAMTYYRQFMRNASAEERSRHYLIVGPWNHEGTRAPKVEFDGLKFGPASLLDLQKLHLEWYAWTLQNGPKPAFLKKPVAYYVAGLEKWRYADTLEAVTATSQPYFLGSIGNNPTDVMASGSLRPDNSVGGRPDHYRYDPDDIRLAEVQFAGDDSLQSMLIDQRMIMTARGTMLIYHTAPFDTDVELSGYFKLSVWLSINQADTDFAAAVYEIATDGKSILLSDDVLRARYRKSVRKAELIKSVKPLHYDFVHFTFVSRIVKKGSRLRLVIGHMDNWFGIDHERNFNAGGEVAEESIQDARVVTVRLFHDREHRSVLYIPIGQPETPDEPVAPETALTRQPS